MYEITLGKHFIFLSFHFLCLFSNDPGKGQLCSVHTFQWAKLDICTWLFYAMSHLVPGRTDRMRPTGNTCDISSPMDHGFCPRQGEPPRSRSCPGFGWGLWRWRGSSSKCPWCSEECLGPLCSQSDRRCIVERSPRDLTPLRSPWWPRIDCLLFYFELKCLHCASLTL